MTSDSGVRRGDGLRIGLTQAVPKSLGAVSITLWYPCGVSSAPRRTMT
jgi:hypothetical protein